MNKREHKSRSFLYAVLLEPMDTAAAQFEQAALSRKLALPLPKLAFRCPQVTGVEAAGAEAETVQGIGVFDKVIS